MSLFSSSVKTTMVLLITLTIQARDKQTPLKTESLNKTRPLNFEVNQGQAPADVHFLVRDSRYALLLSERNATFLFLQQSTHSSLQMNFVGARTPDAITGDGSLPGKVNYLIGNDPKRWHQSVPTFARIHYQNLYKGINLTFYGTQQQLEYDFVITPHADVRVIRLSFSTTPQALSVDLEKNGDLLCHLPNREFRLRKPVFYQPALNAGGPRESVDGQFVKLSTGEIGFAAGPYDHARPLIIDPVISYSSYLGGSGDEGTWAIQQDSAGNLYLAGETTSADFPTLGPVQSNWGGNYDAFVSKFDSSGTLIYSTYLGGSKYENPDSLAVGPDGSAYIAGRTESADYPTVHAIQATFGGISDAFVARLDPSGSQLIFSTYLGGINFDAANGIALGPDNAIYVAGQSRSTNFPVTAGAYQTRCDSRANPWLPCLGDAFISKLDSTGSTLLYSTYLGGSSSDYASGIAVDLQGTIYISGNTSSSDFPVAQPYQAKRTGTQDMFLTSFSPEGKSLIFSTYFGGSASFISYGLALDRFHNAYVIGMTTSSDLPTISPFQPHLGGSSDGFVAKFNDAGQPVYASYLGGSKLDWPFRVAVDSSGSAVVAGFTQSSDFPILNAVQPSFGGGLSDAFVTKISPDGSRLVYSTYLGGTGDEYLYALYSDESGNVWVGGSTSSRNFPLINAFQGSYAGGPFDAFFTKISADPAQPEQ